MTRRNRMKEEMVFAGRKLKSIFCDKKSGIKWLGKRTTYVEPYLQPGVDMYTHEDIKHFRATKIRATLIKFLLNLPFCVFNLNLLTVFLKHFLLLQTKNDG